MALRHIVVHYKPAKTYCTIHTEKPGLKPYMKELDRIVATENPIRIDGNASCIPEGLKFDDEHLVSGFAWEKCVREQLDSLTDKGYNACPYHKAIIHKPFLG